MIRRRNFLTLLGGAAAAWPAMAMSQEKVRRIAFLSPFPSTNPEGTARVTSFVEALRRLGWNESKLQIAVRWGQSSSAEIRKHATEIVSQAPDVIVASGSAVGPILQMTATIPVVFANVIDAEGVGIVESIARPSRNATGFMQFEYSTSGKWLDLLKEIAPRLARVAVLRDNA